MKDILGNELVIGDNVVYTIPKYHYLIVGKIVDILPKTVRVVSIQELALGNPLNSGNTTARESCQVAKIN